MKILFDEYNPEHIKDYYGGIFYDEFNRKYKPCIKTIRQKFPHLKDVNRSKAKPVFDKNNPEHMENFEKYSATQLRLMYQAKTVPNKMPQHIIDARKKNKELKRQMGDNGIIPRNLNSFKWDLPPVSYGDLKPAFPDIFGKRFK